MSIVQLDHIRKVYGSKVAVEGLSLTIVSGTMFGRLDQVPCVLVMLLLAAPLRPQSPHPGRL
jgi:hypothetical protein